ncbi:MAG TPA: sialidase family protein [Ignavibacteria bacterium]|nr:sialidase family protein [Ignavibacteria bacterium]
MNKRLSKILPPVFSILIFTSAFIYFTLRSSDQENSIQLSPERIYYSDKFRDNTSYEKNDITEAENILNVRLNVKAGVSEPKIVCSPADENILAVAANNFSGKENSATIFLSTDKGKSWDEKQIPLSDKFESSTYSDPYIEFDPDGNIDFITVQRDLRNRSKEGLCFSKSSDNGDSWITNSEFVDYNGKEIIHLDKPKLVSSKNSKDQDLVFITWTEFKGLNSLILFAASTDGGATFSQSGTIDNNRVKFSSIVSNNNNELFALYLKNDNEINIKKSFDNGSSWKEIDSRISINPAGTFSNGQYLIKNNSEKGIRINSEPNVVLSGNSDLSVTYTSGSEKNDQSDIYYCKFLNSSSEFTKPVKVNSDNTNCDQFMPAISEDRSGNIFIVYQDSRDDDSNILISTYLSYSTDGGKTFYDKKISLKSFDPGNISVRNYISDHNSCVFAGNQLVAVWTDGRNNNFDLYAGIISYDDIIKH